MKIVSPINDWNRIRFRYSITPGLITVIIPVYKDIKGLGDTLRSLSIQTISKDQFEVIVANDGADIEISKLCESFGVKEVKIKPNLGSYNARNRSLEVSKGEYLAFTDADVIVPSDWLHKGLTAFQKADYIASPVKFIKKNKLSLTEKYATIWEFNIDQLFENDYYGVTANLFVKRIVIVKLGGFDSRLQSGGDNEFGNRVRIYSTFKQKFNHNNPIQHPFRIYKEIIVKKERIVKGVNNLVNLFPKRYEKYKYILFDDALSTLTPPLQFIDDFPFFLFLWHMKIIDLYINLKYRHNNMLLIHKNSKVHKMIRYFRIKLDK